MQLAYMTSVYYWRLRGRLHLRSYGDDLKIIDWFIVTKIGRYQGKSPLLGRCGDPCVCGLNRLPHLAAAVYNFYPDVASLVVRVQAGIQIEVLRKSRSTLFTPIVSSRPE